MSKTKIKISIVINILIFILTIAASIIMFTGFKFMFGPSPNVESTSIGMFRFFTVDSNVFMGIMALIFAVYEIRLLKEKVKEIPFILYILKLMATSAVGLTFVVVFTYLGPICKDGIITMLQNSNLFFHLIIPVLSMINFVVFERTNIIKFKHCLFGIIPMLLYAAYYLINCLIHSENGIVSVEYDWYWFVQGGLWQAFIVVPVIFAISYVITIVLWRLNKIKSK